MDDHALDVRRLGSLSADAWETVWAPYDEATYAAALAFLRPDDVVLDIGAGDLRFARRAARAARAVIAVERQAAVLARALRSPPLPDNLTVVTGDALAVPYPAGITAAVLLMRHCRRFGAYVSRLRAAGCGRLITNARWGMGVECLSLTGSLPYAAAPGGWYACDCGAVGFKSIDLDRIDSSMLARATDVTACPICAPSGRDQESTWSAS